MTTLTIVIPADPEKPIGWLDGENAPEVEWVREQLGGSLEVVPHWDDYMGWPAVAYCNEEGKLEGLPLNHRATQLWWMKLGQRVDDVLVGNVVLCVELPLEDADK